ncbi:MAG: hypothetical protein JJE52_17040 [Acidimicrobiia bacterium]|nr:hypothetical protein [Acidimicrobiia bacterium]
MRARDVRKGDVVARDPQRLDAWFRVHEINVLPDGQVNVLDKSNTRSFLVGPFDLVGLQTPVALPAEADVTVVRQRPSAASNAEDLATTTTSAPTAMPQVPNGAAAPAAAHDQPAPSQAGSGAAAREAVAREMHPAPVRGSLPPS